MIRFLICDGDDVFCGREKAFIENFYKELGINAVGEIYGTCKDVAALGEKISLFDAIFLDVRLDSEDALDFCNWLRAAAPEIIIVFVSESMSYAIDGYRVGASRFIMKNEEQFICSMEECLRHILAVSRAFEPDYIYITDEKIRVSVDKILYVESNAHRVTYHLVKNNDTKQEYTVYGKLNDVEKKLSVYGFCRVHQSYLVNMNYVKAVSRYEAVLFHGAAIRISKARYKLVEDAFIRMKGTF